MCLFISTESIQSCSHFNISYTLPSPTRYSFSPWVTWSIWGLSAFPRTHHRNYVPRLRGEKHDISLTILHQAGFETAWQAATLAKSCFLVLNRGNKPIGLAWVPLPQKREAWNAIIVGLVYSGPPMTHLCERSTKDTRLANIETKLYSRLDAGVFSWGTAAIRIPVGKYMYVSLATNRHLGQAP